MCGKQLQFGGKRILLSLLHVENGNLSFFGEALHTSPADLDSAPGDNVRLACKSVYELRLCCGASPGPLLPSTSSSRIRPTG